MINLVDEVGKLRLEIIAKFHDSQNQVSELVANELLVIKEAIIEDLWKIVLSKGSTDHKANNHHKSGEND